MTPYQNIYARFALKVQDYTLDELFAKSLEDYESYLRGWLKSAITKFSKCLQDLTDRNDEEQVFNIELTELEEEILATLMEVEWSEKEVKNIMEIRLALSDSDYRRYAEANNLRAKLALQNQLIERADRLIVEYTYANYDFSNM